MRVGDQDLAGAGLPRPCDRREDLVGHELAEPRVFEPLWPELFAGDDARNSFHVGGDVDLPPGKGDRWDYEGDDVEGEGEPQFQLTVTPISRPIPQVPTAAMSPKSIWRIPDASTGRAVNRVIPAPSPKSATPDSERLPKIADDPVAKRNGSTGTIAPTAKSAKDVHAATHGEPPNSFGSMPSSSRAMTSSAPFRSVRMRFASAWLSRSSSPRAW